MDSCLKKLLTQTVTVKKVTGLSASGASETLGAASSIKAYIQIRTALADGNQRLNTSHVVITEVEITRSDRVWLPGTDTTSLAEGRTPETVSKFFDIDGTVSHYEVML